MLQINNNIVKHLIGCVSLLFFTIYISFLEFNKPVMNFDIQNFNNMSYQMTQIQKIETEQQKFVDKVRKIAKSRNTDLTDSQLDSVAYLIYSMQFKYDNLNPDLICAQITQESNWNSKAISGANAKGLMQIVNSTGAYLAVSEGYTDISDMEKLLYDPLINIKLGCRYISEMSAKHGVNGGLVAYNSGPKYARVYNREKHTDNLPKETQKYLPKVLGYFEQYKMM